MCAHTKHLLSLCFICARLTIFHISFLAMKTTSIVPVCPECGITKKSGKMSCCARGGSWFGNCGSDGDGNTNFDHTWHEGIQVCKGQQLQAVVGQQEHASQPKSNVSSINVSMDMNSKAVTGGAPDNPAIVQLVGSTAAIFITTPSQTSDSTSAVTQEYGKLSRGVTHIISIAIVIFYWC